ncbi:phage tail tape measure protein (plasmid) [Natrinema thermotolerans]|nr:phage tail tape measure protein [Natrinema thermotolerans]
MGALAVDTSKTFEQSMANSLAVMGDVSESMEEDLEGAARRVARETTVSASEAADAYYYLSSAGLSAAQAMEAMPTVTQFSEAAGGALNMAEATDIATNVMSAYGYEANEMGEVTDTLTAVTQNHNQTVNDMASAMSQVAPVASSLGVPLEEASTAIGMLGDQGISAEKSGTALRNILSQLSDSSSTAAKQLQEAGVQTQDAEGNMLPLAEVLEQIEESSLEASDASQIFGREAGPAAAALIQQGSDALEENADRVRESEDATSDMAEEMRSTTQGEIQQMRSNLEDVGLTIGSVLLPMLSTATSYVSGAAEWFQNLNEGQQKAIVVVGGLAAALGPLLIGVGTLLTMLPTMATGAAMASGALSGALLPSSVAASGGLSGMAASALAAQVSIMGLTAPVWAVISAIGLLLSATAIFAAAYSKNWKGIRDYTEWAIDPITDGIDWFVEKLFGISSASEKVAGAFGDFIDWVVEKINSIPKINLDSGDLGDFDTSSAKPGDKSASDVMGAEENPYEDIDYGEQGQQAGQDFGTGFQNGLELSDVTSHLDDEIASVEEELSDLHEGGVALEDQEEAAELQRRLRELKEQREEVREADDITDVDSDIAAEAVRSDLQAEEERAAYLDEVYSQIDGKEAPEAASGPSMSSEDVDEQSVEAMLAESEGSSQNTDLATKLDKIIEKHDQLRETVKTLQLIVEMDLNSREFNKIIDNRAEAKAKEVINNTGP